MTRAAARRLGFDPPPFDITKYEAHATHVRQFRSCQRAWYFEHVLRAKRPPSRAQKQGTAVHAQREAYFKHGTPCADPVAAAGLDDLPPAAAARDFPGLVLVEHKFKVRTKAGAIFAGTIDLLDLRRPALPTLWDHKTTAGFSYAKSEDAIEGDVQLNAYAFYALSFKAKDADHIEAGWHFTRTRGEPGAKPVQAILTRQGVRAQWASVLQSVHDMKAISRLPVVHDVPGNRHVCMDYNGCPFIDDCDIGTAVQEGREP